MSPKRSWTASRTRWLSPGFPTTRCPLMAITPLVTVQTCRSWTDVTPGIEAMRSWTSSSAMPAGGVSTSKQALHMLVLVKETLGDDWLTPERFRIGASSVLNDLLMQYEKALTGRYGRAEDFSKE